MGKTNVIKNFLFLFLNLLLVCKNGNAQNGFKLPEKIDKDKISFKLINNLVVIPVEVNGVVLSFLLDTGVSKTIMFSLSEVDSLALNDTKEVRLRGMGDGGSIPALKSSNNRFKIGESFDNAHTLYVIFDKSLDLSKRMGVPIHGIIGYEFFKNLIVKTNYSSKRLIVYKPEKFDRKSMGKYEEFNLLFNNNKPYLSVETTILDRTEEVTLLIDSGSSDAIWLFEEEELIKTNERKYFEDFLGQGISGVIFGKRAKLTSLKIGEIELKNVKVAYPDALSMQNIKFFKNRDGSLGGEILKRFTVVLDYQSKKIYFKRNRNFKLPFHYNMSGITIKHDGVELVKEKKNYFSDNQNENSGATNISIAAVYSFHLVPKFIVSEIRKDSPADLAGIMMGDELLTVNGREVYKYKLHEIIGLFSSKAEKKITLKIKRNGVIYRKKFILKEML